MPQPHVLLTGALGQIGRVLADHLVQLHGANAVLATDLAPQASGLPCAYLPLDATNSSAWASLSAKHAFTEVYHLVAVLSAKGEAQPWQSWDINMLAYRNLLNAAHAWPKCRIFFPSSIAVYGPPLPKSVDETQVLQPTTSYGISKVAGELWGSYLSKPGGLDVRSLRLPGVIGHQTMPGGGTTDYAVEIYHAAAKGEEFSCFLAPNTRLPMIYMDDLLRGITEFMAAPRERIARSGVYNLPGFSVTPAELAASIRAQLPDFKVVYRPDHRQAIAASWPETLVSHIAVQHWQWQPRFDASATTAAMLEALIERYAKVSSPSSLS